MKSFRDVPLATTSLRTSIARTPGPSKGSDSSQENTEAGNEDERLQAAQGPGAQHVLELLSPEIHVGHRKTECKASVPFHLTTFTNAVAKGDEHLNSVLHPSPPHCPWTRQSTGRGTSFSSAGSLLQIHDRNFMDFP